MPFSSKRLFPTLRFDMWCKSLATRSVDRGQCGQPRDEFTKSTSAWTTTYILESTVQYCSYSYLLHPPLLKLVKNAEWTVLYNSGQVRLFFDFIRNYLVYSKHFAVLDVDTSLGVPNKQRPGQLELEVVFRNFALRLQPAKFRYISRNFSEISRTFVFFKASQGLI